MVSTTVHLVRHGEVHNPSKILYGRLPGYRLSELGQQMAHMVADDFSAPRHEDDKAAGQGDSPTGSGSKDGTGTNRLHDITRVVASPLQRAQETAAPIARAFDLEIHTDERLIEAANHFEGMKFGEGDGSPWRPKNWRFLFNPFRPSWGEPYREQVARMVAAINDARDAAAGHEAVLVSHQLPIWVTRLAYENKRLWHDPRRRQCTLASVTSLHFEDDALALLTYTEPAAGLLPDASPVAGA